MTTDPVPQRLSDSDRDAAAGMLRQHFEAGRLDDSEFTERMGTALAARFAADLTPLFADLPDPHPDSAAPASPSSAPPAVTSWAPPPPTDIAPSGPSLPPKVAQWVPLARGLIWPLCILAAIVVGNWFTFIAIAIVGSIVLGHLTPEQRKPPPQISR